MALQRLLVARGLAAAHGERTIFSGIDLTLGAGTLTALIGPNGCGKTTLLHTLCGLHRAAAGDVELLGDPIQRLGRREIARRLALVAQFSTTDVEMTVEEVVTLGRYPTLTPWAPLSAADRGRVSEVIQEMELTELTRRRLSTLSGGERQRALLARALAQATPVLLLDEPVTGLDLRHQQETYLRLGRLARAGGMAVLVADHHLDLVGAACDEVLVLHGGRLAASGPPERIITEAMIREVFGARMRVRHDEGGRPQCVWEF